MARIEVPVMVVGRDGQPVRDLGIENFLLLDRGRRQEILDFEVIDLRRESREAEVRPDKTAKMRRKSLPPAGRRRFLLLFDLSFSKPSAIAKARTAARDLVLEQLHPTDLAAVATYSLDIGPQLVLTFTPDRAQLARAIDTIGHHRRRTSSLRMDPLSFLIDASEGLSESYHYASEQGLNRGFSVGDPKAQSTGLVQRTFDLADRNYERNKVKAWSRSMADMAKVLNSVAGHKQVIYFSEGFDSSLAFGNASLDAGFENDRLRLDRGIGIWMGDSEESFGSAGIQQDLAHMLEEFRRADCTIQTVDIAGLRTEIQGDRSLGTEALYFLANETGGFLFDDSNMLGEHLGELLERSTVTYLLSFQATNLGPDGSYHRIRVKLRDVTGRPEVSHRAGYYVPRPFEDLHPLEKDLLASDAIAAATPIEDVKIELLSAPFRAGHEQAYVPIIIEIDGSTLLQDQPTDHLTVEIYAYVTDANGEMQDFFTERVGLLLDSDRRALSSTGLKYYGHFELDEGEHLIRVLVRNEATGKTGVAALPLEIPSFGDKTTVVLPPFFLASGGGWVLVRESRDKPEGDSVVYPFTIGGEPYVPEAMPRTRSREGSRLCLVAYNLGRGAIELESNVLSADGRLVSGGHLELLERTVTGIRGLDKLDLLFKPEGLAAGIYNLAISLTDPSTGSTQTAASPFVVGSDPGGF